jgi:hypothetical protein
MTCQTQNVQPIDYRYTSPGVPRRILSFSNPKMDKGKDLPYYSAILHLSPANLSGYQTCSHASPECKFACLNTSGRGRFDKTQLARIEKTRWLFESEQQFLTQLQNEIRLLVRKAEKLGLKPVIRLNGTSDLGWHMKRLKETGLDLIRTFPSVQFYDYTKLPSRVRSEKVPENYHLTFSLSESNDAHALDALARGFNVAAVLRLKDSDPMPRQWSGYPVTDGTLHDYRFLDPSGGHIVGLRPKGRAKHDKSGFARP